MRKLALEQFLKLPEAKQWEILNAAIEEFANSGYELASTNRMVEQAGISKGVLFKYFSNKERLFLYVCKLIAQKRMEWLTVQACDLPNDLIGILRFFAHKDLEYLIKEPMQYALLEQVKKQIDHPICKKAMAEFQEQGRVMFSAVIDALPTGNLREGVTIADAVNMIQWIFEGFNKQMSLKIQGDFEQRKDEISAEIDKVLDLLQFGICSADPKKL